MAQTPSGDPTVPPTLLRISTLGPFAVEYRDPHTRAFMPLPKEKWHGKGATPALSLLKLLISQPHRYAPQDWILEQFWPETEVVKAESRLHDASYFLRSLLHPFTSEQDPFFWYVRHTKTGGGGYRLAEYPLIWIDADAFAYYMGTAALHERMGDDPFPFLEKAYHLGARGTFLVEEVYSEWAQARRQELDGAFRLCVHQLGRHCLEKRDFIQAEYFVRSYWVNHIADEDALRLLMDILGEQGRYQEAYDCYRQTKSIREQEREAIDPRTHDLAEYWRTKPISRPAKSSPQPSPVPSSVFPSWAILEHPLKPRHSDNETLWQSGTPLVQALPVTYNRGSQLSMLPPLELQEMFMLSRRRALSEVLNLAFASLGLSRSAFLPQESREHLERVMTHSSYVDGEAIGYFAVITQKFWDLRRKGGGIDQLSGITGHFTDIIQLLKESRPSPIYEQLCALASENAQLLGRIFSEIREYNLAWNYYTFSMKTAQDINHTDLWASGVARLAELLIRWGEPHRALPLLEAAQKRIAHDPQLRVWLATIEAEIYAMTEDMDGCLRALNRSKNITLPASPANNPYGIGFINPSVIAGYEGACWMRLHKPELALPALNEAFATHNPTSLLRRSLILANTGRVHAQLGDVTKAYQMLLESLNITEQTKSLIALQRIYQGRAELDPWEKSGEVKDLDERILEVYNLLATVKEWA
jgi:DNA-binding SARP family transcriptional activator